MLTDGASSLGSSSVDLGQSWTLDGLGNWSGFSQTSTTNPSSDVTQTRQANLENQITNITNTTGTPWRSPRAEKPTTTPTAT